MKRISGIRKIKHKLLVRVVRDYFGQSTNYNIIKSLLGFKIDLTEREKSDKWAIEQNLLDKTYLESFN